LRKGPAVRRSVLLVAYVVGDIATFVFLMFFDGYHYTWWNWILVVPLNLLISTFWPIYWLVLRPLFA